MCGTPGSDRFAAWQTARSPRAPRGTPSASPHERAPSSGSCCCCSSRDPDAALDHARTLLALERALRLPCEQAVQAVLLGDDAVVRLANGYYAGAHLPVTALTLLWLLLRRPATYRRARTALVQATTVALGTYLLVPVAPPRMLPGFVDTGTAYGQSVYSGAGGTALVNEYAALPSLHVGWAVLAALAATSATRSGWRWLWLLHPLVTVVVVVGTANHFWLDAAAGALLLTVAWWLARPRHVAQDGTAPTSTRTSRPLSGSEPAPGAERPGQVEVRRTAPGRQDVGAVSLR